MDSAHDKNMINFMTQHEKTGLMKFGPHYFWISKLNIFVSYIRMHGEHKNIRRNLAQILSFLAAFYRESYIICSVQI